MNYQTEMLQENITDEQERFNMLDTHRKAINEVITATTNQLKSLRVMFSLIDQDAGKSHRRLKNLVRLLNKITI